MLVTAKMNSRQNGRCNSSSGPFAKAGADSSCSPGGEPTLRDDLEQLVSMARKFCGHVTLITNGTLLAEPRIKSLIQAGVSLFELPLNSSDRMMHDQMAGCDGTFDNVTKAAVDICHEGGELAIVFVGTSRNIGHWKDAIELGVALGARSFLFNRYNAGGACHGNPASLMPSVEQVRQGLEVAEAYACEYGVSVGASIAIPPCLIDPSDFPHVGFGFCAAGTDRAYYTIDPLGNVRPCNHTPTVLGNLFEASLRDMTRSPRLKEFMKARPSFCYGCALENRCLGGCKAAAEVCCGSLIACDPFLELNKVNARKLAVVPASLTLPKV
jgi:pyrroloquinoline quinone biosynthesis protein E